MEIESITYQDRIYGDFQITEAVLIDLIHSQAVQRLHGILQHGITGLLGITRNTSRFEHSMGVMLLVRRLGASLEEQIAALLHDISHTTFSHVIDYVFDGHLQQSYHEIHKEAFMAGTDLPGILSAFGYDWRDFLHEDQYSLLEQASPALCADRLDYFLRDSLDLRLASLEEIQQAIQHLVVYEGQIVTNDLHVAQWLGLTFMKADQASWANFREVGLYEITAQAIRYGLRNGVINEQDFWLTDQVLWAKLQNTQDTQLKQQLDRITPETRFTWDTQRAEFWVATKLRTIDPPVLLNGVLQPLSQIDQEFARQRQDYLSAKSGKWPVYVEPSLR